MLSELLFFYFIGSCLCCHAKRPTKGLRSADGEGVIVICSEPEYLCTENPFLWVYNLDFVCCYDGSQCVWDGDTLAGCVSDIEYAGGYTFICLKNSWWSEYIEFPENRGCRPNHCTKDGACCDDNRGESYGKFCQCPHDRFNTCHVCEDCVTEEDAVRFAFGTRNKQGECTDTPTTTVFSAMTSSMLVTKPVRCRTEHRNGYWECSHTLGEPDWTCSWSGPHVAYGKHDKTTGHYYYLE